MLKEALGSIVSAFRKLFAHWGATLISLLLYVVLIAALYFFFTIREATAIQVALGVAVLPLLAIVSFFVLQAMGLSFVRIGIGPGYMLRRALTDFWKLLVISLPVLVLAGLAMYFSSQLETRLAEEYYRTSKSLKLTAFTWGRSLVLYFILPLIAVHLWIPTLREGVPAALKGFFRNIARAFSPAPVLLYAVISAVFGGIVWLLLFTKTPAQSAWLELWLFGLRLAAALVAVFLGWFLMLGSMAELATRRAMREEAID